MKCWSGIELSVIVYHRHLYSTTYFTIWNKLYLRWGMKECMSVVKCWFVSIWCLDIQLPAFAIISSIVSLLIICSYVDRFTKMIDRVLFLKDAWLLPELSTSSVLLPIPSPTVLLYVSFSFFWLIISKVAFLCVGKDCFRSCRFQRPSFQGR